MDFPGFPRAGLAFLADLAANNQRAWFAAHKATYQAALLEPAQQFVAVVGARLRALAPQVQVDLRTDGQGNLMRLVRDTRFSSDKTPYKTELSGLFWEGAGEKTANPAFGFRLRADGMDLMAGMLAFSPPALRAYRVAVADERKGAALVDILDDLRARAGYLVQGEHYRRVPAGYDPQHPRADLLRYHALAIHPPALAAEVVCSDRLVGQCIQHFAAMAPLRQWLANALDPARPAATWAIHRDAGA